jgi:MAF protein
MGTSRAGAVRASPHVRLVAPLHLASASPRRAEILQRAGFAFAVEPARTVEPPLASGAADPALLTQRLAAAKVADVAARHPQEIVLGADTVVVFDDRVLGKPSGPADAKRVLAMLRGQTHTVITAVAVGGVLGAASGTRMTTVTFRHYSDVEIERYVASSLPLDKAGSYGIQDVPFRPASEVDGCYQNVVGLPLCLVGELLGDLRSFVEGSSRPDCDHRSGGRGASGQLGVP